MERPLKQIGDEIRQLTDEEMEIFLADLKSSQLDEPEPTEETPTE